MPPVITVHVLRQDRPATRPYPQTFEIPHQPDMNVISVLQEIAAHPVTREGDHTTPVAWDCNCLEEVCGACSMIINGRVRQACSCLVDELLAHAEAIELRPMTKFPVLRDLVVDRSRMFAALQRIQGWIPVDTYAPLGPGPRIATDEQEVMYPLSRCMTCGCCLEACPQVNEHSDFIGPQAIAQAALFNLNPTGKLTAGARLRALMEPGGITDCGNAQNCVKVCPKGVPLTWALGKLGWDTTWAALRNWLLK